MESEDGITNAKKEFCTPLSIAVAHGQLEVAELLVRRKADPTLVVYHHKQPPRSPRGLIANFGRKVRDNRNKKEKKDKKDKKEPRPSPYQDALLRLSDAIANTVSESGPVRMNSSSKIESLPSGGGTGTDINFKRKEVMCAYIHLDNKMQKL